MKIFGWSTLLLLSSCILDLGRSQSVTDPERQTKDELDMEDCLDAKMLIRRSGESWFVASTCEDCSCEDGNITCNIVKRPCPQAPDPSCTMVEMAESCCPTWDCSMLKCNSRKLGEVWSDDSDLCRPNICTEDGIRKTINNCSQVDPPPDSSCYMVEDENCCLAWQCNNCPDPHSFNITCIQEEDQCSNHLECNIGETCCSIAGCGKECMVLCIDSNGTSRALGQTWSDPKNPDRKLICRIDGVAEVNDDCDYHFVDELDDDHVQDEDILDQDGDTFAGQTPSLTILKNKSPLRNTKYYLDNYSNPSVKGPTTRVKTSTSTQITGSRPPDFSPDLVAIQEFANKFNWSALMPLLSIDISSQKISAFEEGRRMLQTRVRLNRRNDTLDVNSPSFKHQVSFKRTDTISTHMANLGHVISAATLHLARTFSIPRPATTGLPILGESLECLELFKDFLRPEIGPACGSSTYRTFDGSCNNVNGRLIGAAFTPFNRALPADYGDGVSTLRRSKIGGILPSAREVSATVNNRPNVKSRSHTILHMTFGQFLDHDLTATPINRGYQGSPFKCCDDFRHHIDTAFKSLKDFKTSVDDAMKMDPRMFKNYDMQHIDNILMDMEANNYALESGSLDDLTRSIILDAVQREMSDMQSSIPQIPVNEDCAPIRIPANDPFYSRHGQTCMEFVRSAPAASCTFGPREQINEHSAYIDGSAIYGVKKKTVDSLRTFNNGLLNAMVTQEGQRLLPPSLDRFDGCNVHDRFDNEEFCFVAGDGRVNEQILLTLFQTVWKREHNRIATELHRINPIWKENKLFQETRRIVIAELQHVVYNEFLPTILGKFVMNILNLTPLTGNEHTTDYDPNVESTINNVFATAAYRFGHSEVVDNIVTINRHGVPSEERLSRLFFTPFSLYENDTVGDLTRGATSQAAAAVDGFFSEEVSGNLFKGSFPFGLDLVALNIQRGRDHGIPGYTKWREHCGLPKVRSFNDLYPDLDWAVIRSLKRVYRDVDDIDLFIAGVAERPVFGGVVGPTFTCLLADQFLRIKRGDRFWYEYGGSPRPFTKRQLKEIRKVSLARILCNNIPEIRRIQPKVLESPTKSNRRVSCNSRQILEYSLHPWKSRRPIIFPNIKIKHTYRKKLPSHEIP